MARPPSMPRTTRAGAEAASDDDVANAFRSLIANDPDIQAVTRRVWGDTSIDQRPSDTPKHLEQANHQASLEIARILQSKGITLPDRTFINPRSGALEGHRGWSGLSGVQKALVIAAAAAATGGAGLALAGGGAAAGAGAGAGAAAGAGGGAGTIAGLGAGLGVSAGVPAGLAGVGATGLTAGGALAAGSGLGVTAGLGGAALPGATGVTAGAAGSSPWISALTNAGVNAAKTKATGGSWTDALKSAGIGAATGGVGGAGMSSWTDLLKDPDTWASVAQIAGQAAGGRSDQRMQQSQAVNQSNLADLALYSAAQNAQNQAGQLDLNRKSFTEDARGGRAKQALLADLISNLKDININVPGVQAATITGGLRPSALGETGRQSLAELSKQALQAQLAGDTFQGGQILPTPQYRAMPDKGGVETALDWIGLLGSVAGVLKNTQQPSSTSTLPNVSGAAPASATPYRNLRF